MHLTRATCDVPKKYLDVEALLLGVVREETVEETAFELRSKGFL